MGNESIKSVCENETREKGERGRRYYEKGTVLVTGEIMNVR